MIFEPDCHVAADGPPWDSQVADSFVRATFESTERTIANTPLEDASLPLYDGIAGICWAQQRLAGKGYGESTVDYWPLIEQACEKQAMRFRGSEAQHHRHGLLLGELGFRLVEAALHPGSMSLDHLVSVIEANEYNPVCDLMCGASGSILAALALIEREPRLAAFVPRAVEQLQAQLCCSVQGDYRVWMMQAPSGRYYDQLGMAHGFAGNALGIIRSFPLLTESSSDLWTSEIRNTIKQTAVREDDLVNWPVGVGGRFLLQQCHGAPGVVCCASELMKQGDDEFDQLLLDGGELIWSAGALRKGSGFCHGTAGNGYAFLKLFQATGDQKWLDRARTFAMIAMMQSLEAQKEQGAGLPSLWTGDTGVSFYVDACVRAAAAIPTLDYF